MNDYSIDTVWPNASEAVREEAIRFWLSESAIPQGVAYERAQQLVSVCRLGTRGEIIAVSTAFPLLVKSLGVKCFFYRAFVGKAHRAKGLRGSPAIQHLIRHSYDALNERFQQGADQDVLGLYMEVQNQSVLRHRRELVWTDLGANIVFLGHLPSGAQTRVWYFDGGVIP